jgi:hypothetical protein|tara:strand:+ start:139 stop:417 length:279 start_codon:yes stop_codon:yes gene_type:complete
MNDNLGNIDGVLGGAIGTMMKKLTEAQDNLNKGTKAIEPKFTILPNGSKLMTNNIISVEPYKKWWWSKIQTEITLNTGVKFVVNCLPTDIKL